MYSNKELKLYSLTAIMDSKIPNKDKAKLLENLKTCSLTETVAFLNVGKMYKGPITDKTKKIIFDEFKSNKKLNESIDNFMFLMSVPELLKEGDFNVTSSTWNLNPLNKNNWSRDIDTKYGSFHYNQHQHRITDTWHKDYSVELSQLSKDILMKAGVVSGTILGLLIIRFAFKIYKKYFTERGKICRKLKGTQLVNCESRVKIEGLNSAIQKMQALKSSQCPKSKDPDKCKKKIDNKIDSYKNKIEKYKAVFNNNK